MLYTYNVLDTVAGAADATLNNRILTITGAPPMRFSDIMSVDYSPYVVENLQVTTVTPTAAISTTFALRIRQQTTSGVIERTLEYTTGASGDTATTISNAWKSQLARYTDLKVTTSAQGTGTLVITGTAGAATFTVTNISDTAATVTIANASSLTVRAGHATAATAVAGTTTVTITTSAAHGYAVGNYVTITDATGFTFTDNVTGVAFPVDTAVRVRIATVPSSTTFTLDRITGSGTNTGTAVVITPIAVNAANTGALLLVGYPLAASGNTYARYIFTFQSDSKKALSSKETRVRQHHLLVNVSDSDAAALDTQLQTLLKAIATTTASIEAISLL